jgi:putative aldouronate transport system substrate-binding protein
MNKRKNRSALLALVSALLLTAALSGCSGDKGGSGGVDSTGATEAFHKTGLPIVDTPVTITVAGGQNVQIKKPWNDMLVFKNLEQKTNVHVEWQLTPNPDWNNKRSLLFAGGDLPDVILNVSAGDLVKYGAQGLLIPLENLIDEYAPNLKKVLDARPEFRRAITAPDGHIYSVPRILDSGIEGVSDTLWINKKWLDQLSLPVPATTEQFRDTLQAFKSNDLNGNGKSDEIPFSFVYGGQSTSLYSLFGAFGVLDNPDHLVVEKGKVSFSAVQPAYKEAIQYFHSLYKAGLIDPESFTQNSQQFTAKGTNPEPLLGAIVNYNNYGVVGTDRINDYVAVVPPLKGPRGDQLVNAYPAYYMVPGALAVTNRNKRPEVTIRWIDQVFEPRTSWEFGFGPFGVNYEEKADGTIEANPNPPGMNFNQFRLSEAPANDFPYIILKDFYDKVKQSPEVENRKKLVAAVQPFQAKEYYPTLLFSEQDQNKLDQLRKDIVDYVNQRQAQWITDGKIDAEWDAYVSQLKKMGLDELLKIYQSNLDRYLSE